MSRARLGEEPHGRESVGERVQDSPVDVKKKAMQNHRQATGTKGGCRREKEREREIWQTIWKTMLLMTQVRATSIRTRSISEGLKREPLYTSVQGLPRAGDRPTQVGLDQGHPGEEESGRAMFFAFVSSRA